MPRRLVQLILLLMVLATGCLGVPTGPTTPSSAGTTTTPAPTATPGEFVPENAVSDRLILRTRAETSVRVVAKLPRKGNQTVFDRTYPPEAGEVTLPPSNETTADYYVQIYVDGELEWEKVISSAAEYELVVHEDGSVEVIGVAEV